MYIPCMGIRTTVSPGILALLLLIMCAPGASCLELTGGVRAGAAGSLFFGGWVDGLGAELTGLGAGMVTPRPYFTWRAGGYLDVTLLDFLSARAELDLGPVGGALLASDGYDMLAGVTALEVALPVLAVAHVRTPVGDVLFSAGIFAAAALPVRQVRNDGVVRIEGELASFLACAGLAGGVGFALPLASGAVVADLRILASLFSIADPRLEGTFNTGSLELTVGWEFWP